jgi:hypothetical protein
VSGIATRSFGEALLSAFGPTRLEGAKAKSAVNARTGSLSQAVAEENDKHIAGGGVGCSVAGRLKAVFGSTN